MRIALLGGGTIARLFLEHIRRGDLGPGIEVAAVCGRSALSHGASLASEYGVPFVTGVNALVAAKPDVVVEAASQDAVRDHLVNLLAAKISVIDLLGREVMPAIDARFDAGDHVIDLNTAELNTGLYRWVLKTSAGVRMATVCVVR